MKSDAFVNAIEAMNPGAVPDVLAEDVTFNSPVVFKPYQGRDVVGLILTEGAMKVFEDFRYTDRFEEDDSAVLVFEARVGDRDVQGIDMLRFDDDGRVRELTVMVRPMSAVHALAEAMGRELERAGVAAPGT
jgi:SnoaL-like protein